MALKITQPAVVKKVEQLARTTGLSKGAVVELALDRLIERFDTASRMAALLAQLDRIPDRPDAFDPVTWDHDGLPQ